MEGFESARILITVIAYPQMGARSRETVCVAGIRVDKVPHRWVRIWPYPLREIPFEHRFKTWDIVELAIRASGSKDRRPESHTCNPDDVRIVGRLDTAKQWTSRRGVIDPLVFSSMCEFLSLHDTDGRSLGVVRAGVVDRFSHEALPPAKLIEKQEKIDLHESEPSLLTYDNQALEAIPFVFRYHWRCDGVTRCPGHQSPFSTHEVGQTYRRYRLLYGSDPAVLEKMVDAFTRKFDRDREVSFFVGNMHRFPQNWLNLGIYNPPRSSGQSVQESLFEPDL